MLREENYLLKRIKSFHCIGIGGTGLSGISEVLKSLGYVVTGSDILKTKVTDRLNSKGIQVYIGHATSNLQNVDAVIYSSAIGSDNVELKFAKESRIPTIPRAQMLAELMRFNHGIAIAGTHGKTTTTSLISTIIADGGKDPTFIVGGIIKGVDANARLGKGEYLVVEADESDGSFLRLSPLMAVLTNVDRDHLENFNGDFALLHNCFKEFLLRLPFYGIAFICFDDPNAMSIAKELNANVITYGMNSGADYVATDLEHRDGFEIFNLKFENQSHKIKLHLSGIHNVQNALAAIAVARELEIPIEDIKNSLEKFKGIDRRCQVYENQIIEKKTCTVIDDYGHHPEEVKMVISTIRRRWPDSRLIVIFQPHRYTRTNDLFEDFVEVLSQVDYLILLEVYAAGEEFIKGADSRSLAKAIRSRGRVEPIFVPRIASLQNVLRDAVEDGDLVAFLGAGDVGKLVENVSR